MSPTFWNFSPSQSSSYHHLVHFALTCQWFEGVQAGCLIAGSEYQEKLQEGQLQSYVAQVNFLRRSSMITGYSWCSIGVRIVPPISVLLAARFALYWKICCIECVSLLHHIPLRSAARAISQSVMQQMNRTYGTGQDYAPYWIANSVSWLSSLTLCNKLWIRDASNERHSTQLGSPVCQLLGFHCTKRMYYFSIAATIILSITVCAAHISILINV